MNHKRLEYDSLKSVLRFMDPNLRIKLTLRCPFIKTVDKVVPLKIEHLASGEHIMTINNTTYKLGIYRQWHNPWKIHRQHQKDNDRGGVEMDIGEWGFRENHAEDPITPGDLVLHESNQPFLDGTTQQKHFWMASLTIYEEARRRFNSGKRDDQYCYCTNPEQRYVKDTIALNEDLIQEYLQWTLEKIEDSIWNARAEYLPYYYCGSNEQPRFTCYIQITILSLKEKVIERVDYSKKLWKAMKYLNGVLFGSLDLRLIVRQMRTFPIDFGKLKELVLEASCPLESLAIQAGLQDFEFFEQEVVKGSKTLIIFNLPNEDGSWLPLLEKLRNQTVILKRQNQTFHLEPFIALIQEWLQNPRPIGTSLAIGVRHQGQVQEIFQGFPIAMDNGRTLEVTYEKVLEKAEEDGAVGIEEIDEENKCKWMFKLIVV